MGKFEIIKSDKGYRFNLKSANHRIILNSESYRSKSSAEKGVESVRLNSQDIIRFVELISKNDMHYFTLKASNGEIIGVSKMYTTILGMKNGIKSVMCNAPKAEIDYIGFHAKVPVAKSTVNTVKVYPNMMPLPSAGVDDSQLVYVPQSYAPIMLDFPAATTINNPNVILSTDATNNPIIVAKNPPNPINENVTVEKEAYEPLVLPKLKKSKNVFIRIIQSISRFFMGNI